MGRQGHTGRNEESHAYPLDHPYWFVAGIIAKLIHPGPNEPTGFILTTILGIVGAFVATYLGQAIGWYRPDQGAGLIGAVVGAIIVLFIWGIIDRRRTVAVLLPAAGYAVIALF
jgi:uncharacterized membrane protein YeaQ/YmgE (transglycosylase-associated protein family)